jgi:hypothetical protein
MAEIVPIHAQSLIMSLAGSKMVEDLNLQRIMIGAHSEQSLDRTIKKLDNLRQYFVSSP